MWCAPAGVGAGPGCRGKAWRWALGRVLPAVCFGALELGLCDAAWHKSRLWYHALLEGSLAGPLACFGLLGVAGVRGRWSPLSLRG